MSKRKPHRPKQLRPAPAAAGAEARREGPVSQPLSKGRKRLFSLVAFVILPILLLGGAELILRVAGYGYSTAFFKRLRIGSEDFLVENDRFGLRFFPPELARSPPPAVMKAKKGSRTCRIFILGESAALGDPRPAFGAGRYLQTLLRERFPEGEFEVICGAMTAISSHGVLPIARECAAHEGDVWIVYMGNNEMVGPFGAATVFSAKVPPRWQVKLSLALQRARSGQLLMALTRKLGGSGKHGPSWGGMQMFTENRILPQDARKETVYRSFARNLEDILRIGRRHGVPIILNTVAVNLKDCPPFGSLLDPGLTEASRQSHVAFCAEAAGAEDRGDFTEALRNFEQAASLAPRSADLQFRWAECLARQTPGTVAPLVDRGKALGPAAARVHYELARDYDALPFRADSRINAIIARVAKDFAGPHLILCDAAELLATNSPAGIPGKEAFYEHVHLNCQGNYLLARAWAAEVERFLPASATNHASESWATQAQCEQRLGLTDWNRYAILEDILQRLSQPPFTGQLGHTQAMEGCRIEMRALRRQMDPPAADQARRLYLAALHRAPEDFRLHENFAQFLEAVGELRWASTEWQQVRQLIPHHHVAYFQAGRLLVRQGEFESGRSLLQKAVAMRPDLAEGWLELGNLHARQSAPRLALEDYERAGRLMPQDARVHYHIGKALSQLNRPTEAIQSWRRALQLRPEYWEAHYALGEELAFAGQTTDARREFETVIRLKPDYSMAHLNLGVALVREGDRESALRHLEEVMRLDPKNAQAPEYIRKLRAGR